MRIGIDLSFLTHGPGITQRGIGRYSVQQALAVASQPGDDTLVGLILPGVDLARVAPQLTAERGIEVRRLPGSTSRSRPAALNEAVRAYRLDAVHFPAPFDEPVENGLAVATIATFYDAIPLAYPDSYLSNDKSFTATYLEAARRIRDTSQVIAISESARDEAIAYLSVAPERCTVAYPFADQGFQPLNAAQRNERLKRLRTTARLPQKYVLAVPHLHHSKNVAGLLDAFARLPLAERSEYPLVIACALDERDRAVLIQMVAARDLGTQVIVTGFVSDEELVALYNAATVVVHVSHLEGFGLPALEALQCGTPVIASRDTATREVVGDAGVLVDAESPVDIANAIHGLLASPERRARLAALGPQQASRFSSHNLAQATWAAYRAAIEIHARRSTPGAVARRVTLASAHTRWTRRWLALQPCRRAIHVTLRREDTPPAAASDPSGVVPTLDTALPGPKTIDVMLATDLAQPGVSRRHFASWLSRAAAAITPGGLFLGAVLIRQSGPPDLSLDGLAWPVFDQAELRGWLGAELSLQRIDNPLEIAEHLPVARELSSDSIGWKQGLPAVLPGGRAFYLNGVAAGLYALALIVETTLPNWPEHFEARQTYLGSQAQRRRLERLQAEQAYLLSMTTMDLTPAWAERLPPWLLKPIRHLRRLQQLGRAQEAQAVLFQGLIESLSGPVERPCLTPVLTELDLRAFLDRSDLE